MNLRRNILASFISQAYCTVIGIVMLPIYLGYLGAEAYGLVGFFSTLVIIFSLLDMGLTPAMSRETARFRGGAMDASVYRHMVRALEGIFLCFALVGGAGLFIGAPYIAAHWLNVTHLDTAEVTLALQLMAVIVALRWMCGLYRGAVSGAEQLVWLAGYSSLVATLRFVGVIPALIVFGATPRVFFGYQLIVAVLELLLLVVRTYATLPSIPHTGFIRFSWSPLKQLMKFSLTIAFTSSVWIIITQADKLFLSKILSLGDYGYFMLAITVASGVSVISGPIITAIAPRLAKLEAEGNHRGLINLYRQSTQFIVITTGAAAISATVFAEPLLWAWTGDKALAQQVAPILKLYAVGNGFQVVTSLVYYLQYAKGDLRLHLISRILFLVFLIPALIWTINRYGALGAGYVWMTLNIVNFLLYMPLVHKRFEPGLHLKWLLRDVLLIGLAALVAGLLISALVHSSDNRIWDLVKLVIAGGLILLAGTLGSSIARQKLSVLQQRS